MGCDDHNSGIHTPCPCAFWGPSWANFGDIVLKFCICFQLNKKHISNKIK